MPTSVRSFSKINLGLAIGPPREDGFHALSTLYQTLALHDVLTVAARRARTTRISLTSSDQRVPLDSRNTVWKIVERTLTELGIAVEVHIHIQKNLPIQGGMGAGSANAAAALLGLERELALDIDPERRLAIAAEVGSDVPLFLVGGSVLGSDRGQVVEQVPDVTLNGQTEIPCVVALPNIGVSTPHAFREWDRRLAALQSLQTDTALGSKLSRHLHIPPVHDTLKKLIRTYASVLLPPAQIWSQQRSPASQISYTGHIRPQANQANGQDPTPAPQALSSTAPTSSEPTRSGSTDDPAKLRGLSREELHAHSESDGIAGESGSSNGVHPDSLLELVRNGIENDFETVVFAQYPSLSEIKRLLIGDSNQGSTGSIAGIAQRALYAALSGSGSALFGLYRSQADATAAQQRLQRHGIKAIVTSTLPRPLYWSNMFAE